MPTPKPVSKKLEEVLGEEVGGSMSEWLDGLESRTEELKHETRADIAEVRQEVRAVREEMRVEFAKVREEMRVGFATVREEMRVSFAKVDAGFSKVDAGFSKVDAGFAKASVEMSTQLAAVLKWMFGIWIGSFVAIVGLLTFFRGIR